MSNRDRLARRRIAAIGRCIAVAMVGGSLVALTASLLSVSKTGWIAKALFVVTVGIAAYTGVLIASLADRADAGAWRGYLMRVSVSTVCALVSGIWAEMSIKFLLGGSEPTVFVRLVEVDGATNSTFSAVEFTLFTGRVICIFFALILTATGRRKGV